MLTYWFIKDSLTDIKGDLFISGQPLNICFEPSSLIDLEAGLVQITMLTGTRDTKISILVTNSLLDTFNSEISQQRLLNLLFAYFFSPNYYKVNGNPAILMPDYLIESDSCLRLKTECVNQGYKKLHILQCGEIQIIDITSFTNNNYTNKITQKINTSILRWLKNIPQENEIYPPYLIISNINKLPEHDKLLILEKTISNHIMKNKLYQGLEALFINKSELDNLRKEIKYLDEEKTNLKSYLFSHSTNSLELLKWYNEQYEVLPLWYKRFGHILKVLMGKRTLRSLFKNE